MPFTLALYPAAYAAWRNWRRAVFSALGRAREAAITLKYIAALVGGFIFVFLAIRVFVFAARYERLRARRIRRIRAYLTIRDRREVREPTEPVDPWGVGGEMADLRRSLLAGEGNWNAHAAIPRRYMRGKRAKPRASDTSRRAAEETGKSVGPT